MNTIIQNAIIFIIVACATLYIVRLALQSYRKIRGLAGKGKAGKTGCGDCGCGTNKPKKETLHVSKN